MSWHYGKSLFAIGVYPCDRSVLESTFKTRKKRFPMNRLPLCQTFFASLFLCFSLFLSLLIVPCLKASQAVSHLSSTLFGAIIAFSNLMRMKLLGKSTRFDMLSYAYIPFHMLTHALICFDMLTYTLICLHNMNSLISPKSVPF